MVDARDAYPQTDQKNVRIRPGYDNLVAVDATSVVASEDIKSVDPKERNCYFGDEVELKAHLYYTQVRIEKIIINRMDPQHCSPSTGQLPPGVQDRLRARAASKRGQFHLHPLV